MAPYCNSSTRTNCWCARLCTSLQSGQSQYWHTTQMKLRVPYAIPVDKNVSFFLEVCRPTAAKIYLVCIFRTNDNKLRVVSAEAPAAA